VRGSSYFLMGGITTLTFGPWGSCSSGSNYTVNSLGVGDAGTGCPDVLPVFTGLASLGMRMNCQRSSGGTFSGNLQSFLVVTTDIENPIDEAMWSGGNRRARVDPEPLLESMRRLDRAREWLRGAGR
jgi:hypothetical protein